MRRLIGLVLWLAWASVEAATLVVSADGGGDYTSIAPAVAVAQDGDTVLIAVGTYRGEQNKNIEFDGKRLVVRGEPGERLPVIDCEHAGRAFRLHEGEPLGTRIEHLRIVNGNSVGMSPNEGGGILIKGEGSVCHIEDVEIADCTGPYAGGISIYRGKVTLLNSKITGCWSWWEGGGVYARGDGCVVVAEDVSIAGCEAFWGAGFCFGGDSLFATRLELTDNAASEYGGGLSVRYADYCELRNCEIEGNFADQLGGGLLSEHVVDLRVVDNLFRDNFAGVAGGGSYFEYIDGLMVEGCVFDGNETQGSGRGGGLRFRNLSNAQLRRCTVTRCYAESGFGAGMSIGQFTDVAIDSCIVAYNLTGGGIATTEYQSGCTVTCSDVYGNGGGNYLGDLPDQTGIAGNISQDPRFCDWNEGNFQLASGSPCLPENNGCGALMGALPEGCALPTGTFDDAFQPGPRLSVLEVFPNPMRGELHLSFTNADKAAPCEKRLPLRIVDPSGRTVYNGELEARALLAGNAKIDLRWQMQRLPAGVYFGQIRDCQDQPHPFRFTFVK